MTTEPAMTIRPRSLFPWFRLTVGALCLAGLIGLLFVPQFLPWVLRFEHATADWRTALLSDRLAGPHPEIAVVTITPATLTYIATPSPPSMPRVRR